MKTMDIQKIISDLVAKISGDKNLLSKFKSDPIALVKSLVSGVDLDSGALKTIVDGIKAKINVDDVAKAAPGILGKIKAFCAKLFKK